MDTFAYWDSLSTAQQEKGVALAAGMAIGVAGSAALNLLKNNNTRETFAIGVQPNGSGGVDVDLLVGIAAIAAGLMSGGMVGAGLIGVGLGAGTQILGREGAVLALEMAQKKQQSTSGLSLIKGGRSAVSGLAGYRKAG